MNITQEQKLQNVLINLSGSSSGYIAAHVHLSKLNPQNRSLQQLKIAQSKVERNIGSNNAMIFNLSNNDIVIIAKLVLLKNIFNALEELKKLFATDMLVVNNYEDSFSKIYSLEEQYDSFNRDITYLLESLSSNMTIPGIQGSMITPEILDEIILKMEPSNIKDTIKKQDVIYIGSENIGKIYFEEYYISLDLLKKKLNIDTNLTADKWLFHYFSESLDKKMLSSLVNMNLPYNSNVSLNLNLSTLNSVEFKKFIEEYEKSLIVELQISDIFADIKNYKNAQKMLHANGHKIAIDSVNEETIKLLDIELLKPDYVKLIWSPSYLQNNQNIELVRELVENIGSDKIVLCRCSDETAIAWGLARNISIYQGFFVDDIINAMLKKQCSFAENCGVKECISKRNYASLEMKIGCRDIGFVDKNPQISIGGDK